MRSNSGARVWMEGTIVSWSRFCDAFACVWGAERFELELDVASWDVSLARNHDRLRAA